jgi:hypothetical protein
VSSVHFQVPVERREGTLQPSSRVGGDHDVLYRMSDDDDDEVRSVLRSLRTGAEPTVQDVMTLLEASPSYAVPLLPQAVIDAIGAKFDMDRDVANGGMDQVVWNHGSELARTYAAAFRTVGAIENADLLDRLASALDAYRAEHGDAIAEEPVRHFLAYRKSVGGASFSCSVVPSGSGLPEIRSSRRCVASNSSAGPPRRSSARASASSDSAA